MSGFWIAVSTRAVYGGLFVDPNHEAPSILGLHPNVFAFIFVTGFLVAGLLVNTFGGALSARRVVSKSSVKRLISSASQVHSLLLWSSQCSLFRLNVWLVSKIWKTSTATTPSVSEDLREKFTALFSEIN